MEIVHLNASYATFTMEQFESYDPMFPKTWLEHSTSEEVNL